MDQNHFIQFAIGFVVLDIILYRLIYLPWLAKKAKAGKKSMWGNMLVVLGVILTSFGTLLYVMFLATPAKTIDPMMLLALSPSLVIGIPSLITGILLIHHSETQP